MAAKSNTSTTATQPKTKAGKVNTSKNKQPEKALLVSSDLFRNTLDNMLDGCQILGFDWRYLYLNAVAQIHNHRPNQELLGNTYMEMWPGIESTHVFAEIKRCMDERIAIHLENRFVYPDGAIGWFNLSIQPVPEGIVIFSQDITERRQAEQQIVQMKRLYATLSQVNQTIVHAQVEEELYQSICDVAVHFGEFALAWVGLLDESTGEVYPAAANGLDVKEWPFKLVSIHTGPVMNGLIATAIRTSRVVTSDDLQMDQSTQSVHELFERYGYHASASIPFQLRGKTIGSLNLLSLQTGFFQSTEEIRLLNEMGLDISFALDNMANEKERKRAEQEGAQLAAIVESSGDAIIGKTLDGIITSWNKGAENVYGYEAGEVVGSPISILIPPNLPDELPTILNQLKAGKSINHYETVRQRKDGRQIDISLTISPIRNSTGQLIGASTIARDISERKQAEERVRESEERFRLLFENNHTVMMLIDPVSGAIRNANTAAAKFYGYTLPKLQAMNINDINTLMPTEIYEERMRALKEARSFFNFQHRLSNGEVRFVEVNSTPFEVNGDTLLFSIVNDITERKRADDALRESEALYRLAIETAGAVPYREVYRDGGNSQVEYEFIGEGIRQITGFGPEEFTIGLWEDITLEMHPLGALAGYSIEEAIERVRLGLDAIWTCDFKIQARDGAIHWVFEAAVELRDEHGISHGSIGLYQDITQRKQAEDALRESEALYRLAIETAGAVPYREVYRDGGNSQVEYEFIGEGIRQITGFGPEEFTERLWEDITLEMHPLGHLANYPVDEAVERVRLGVDSIWQCDFKLRARDGTIRWVFEAAVELRDEHGISHGSIGLYQDITERKQAEEALKRNEHILWLFVEHSPASIAMFDREMKYIVFSHRYLVDYGLGEQDLTGRSHYEVFPEIPEHWKEIHRRCLSGAIEKADADPFVRTDGGTDWVRWEIHPWYEEPGRVGGLILFSEVITERKEVQDELRILNLELEQRVVERTMELSQANRAKDEFLANMSHELRTPLNTVLGLSESLLEQRRGALNEKQIQSIQLIASSGQHLLNLINDILEVSKIEAGKLQLRPTTVSVKELCESSLNFIKEAALKKSISVEFNNAQSISMFNADPQRIKQILINLLTNAVKFTPERGRVILDVNTNAERDQILFSITDTGIGIARDDLKKLFTPFTQLDSGLARQYEGTGLGLALVHKLTELHGGSVQVESDSGKGSRFTVALPLHQDMQDQTSDGKAAEPAEGVQESEPLSTSPKERGVILLAEDNEINSEMFVDYLEGRGYKVLVAWNGEDALEKAAEFAPDIILMDIQMPKMDGLEATRRLRADPRFISMPIVALTALVMPGDKERCLEAGVNEYLSKPVNLKTLLQVIERLIQPKAERS